MIPVLPLLCLITLQKPGEYRKGVVYGEVLDLAGKPVPNATVALKSREGKVVAWTKTNDKGQYAIPADPKVALQIRPSRHRGLLEQCLQATAQVAMMPLQFAGQLIMNPGPAVRIAGAVVAGGTPGAVVGQSVAAQMPNPGQVGPTEQAMGGAAAYTALGPGNAPKQTVSSHAGQAELLVSAPGYQNAGVISGTYWIEGPKSDRENPVGVQAWMDDIKLVPAADKKNHCVVTDETASLSDGLAEPSPVVAGEPLKIQVKLNRMPARPGCPEQKVRVFARQPYGDRVAELTCADPKTGMFAGALTLDPKTPAGETTICVGALREEPVEVHIDPKRRDALLRFCRNLDDLKPDKPYEYDPMVMACKNRMDFKVTVLSHKTEHATTATPPPPHG